MSDRIVEKIQAHFYKKELPNVRTGYEIEVTQKVIEGSRQRLQKFKGLVIKTHGKTPLEKTVTVRAKLAGGYMIEKIFPLLCPTIENIQITRKFKVRRANIRFIRSRTNKAARLKEIRSV